LVGVFFFGVVVLVLGFVVVFVFGLFLGVVFFLVIGCCLVLVLVFGVVLWCGVCFGFFVEGDGLVRVIVVVMFGMSVIVM